MLRFEKKTEYDYALEAKELSRDAGISFRTAQLLLLRGITTAQEAEAFMHPLEFEFYDPLLFEDMKKAVERIEAAIKNKEKICVFGDYDADGVCATAILVITLKRLNADVFYYIPSRHDEGYGITVNSIDDIAKKGTKLIITVDNGIKAIQEAKHSKLNGIDLIVTDHHIPGDSLPDCCAVVCHTTSGCTYPNKNICGAGTALKLCQALAGESVLSYGLGLVGIATVTDIVPLSDENKAFVAHAIKQINAGKGSVGINELLNVASKKRRRVTAYDFGFVIGPRLNAAGRIEDADIAVKLLLSDDKDEASKLALKLDELNLIRKQEEQDIYSSIEAVLEENDITDKRTIVLKSTAWNPGVIGVAAAKVAERYMRPTILFSERDGILTGSGRSIRGVSLYTALNDSAELFMRFGGHSYAAGLTMDVDNYNTFCQRFEDSINAISKEEDYIPRQSYELELDIGELNYNFAEEIESLAPYGEGNPTPVFLMKDVMLKKFKVYGTETTHLSTSVIKNNIYQDAFYPFAGDSINDLLSYSYCDVLYSYEVNTYQDKRSSRMLIKNVKRADSGEPAEYAQKHSSKFISALYRNIKYNSNCFCCGAKFVNAEKRIEELNEKISGTIILVFTVLGATRFLKLGKNVFCNYEIAFYKNKHDICAYNTAVFAPVLDELELKRFKHIIVFDTAISLGMLDSISALAPNATIEVDSLDYDEAREELDILAVNRDVIKKIYLAIKDRGGSFYNKSTLVDSLRGTVNKPDSVIELAIDVFIELNFLSVEGQTLRFVSNAPFRKLEDSTTYKTASLIKEMYTAYKARRNRNGS